VVNYKKNPPVVEFDYAALPCPPTVTNELLDANEKAAVYHPILSNATLQPIQFTGITGRKFGCREHLIDDVLGFMEPLGEGGVSTAIFHCVSFVLVWKILQELRRMMPWLWDRYVDSTRKDFRLYIAQLKMEHTLLSVIVYDDPVLTRPQRLTSLLALLIGSMALLGIIYGEFICNIEDEQAHFLDDDVNQDCVYPTWGVKTVTGILACLGIWPIMIGLKRLFRSTALSRPVETSAETKERHRIERVLRQSDKGLVTLLRHSHQKLLLTMRVLHVCLSQGRGHTSEEYMHALQLATARWIFVTHNIIRLFVGLAALLVATLLELVSKQCCANNQIPHCFPLLAGQVANVFLWNRKRFWRSTYVCDWWHVHDDECFCVYWCDVVP
jgi:hypothetical protein